MLIFGLIMFPFGGIMETFWHIKDYWNPPYLIDIPYFYVEANAFSFLISGITVGLYDFLFTKNHVKIEGQKKAPKYFSLFLLFSEIAILLIFTNYFGYNSLIVSSFSFMLFSAIMIFIRKDLLIPSLLSGILVVLIIIPIYYVLLNILSPNYVDTYFFLTNSKLGTTILGNIPLTELFWYFSWACCSSILYDFQRNYEKIKSSKRLTV